MNIEYVHEISVEDYSMLRRVAGWVHIKESRAAIGLKNSAFIVVAKNEGKTIGMGRVVSDGGAVAYVADVSVLPEYQGYGIGREIMQKIMDFIRHELSEEGLSVYALLISAQGKESFYNKFGFVTRPTGDRGAGMTQWIAARE